MSYFLSPVGNDQQVDTNGKPLVGGKLWTYLAGTSTPATTYTSSLGTIEQANPIVLNALGAPASPIWLLGGVALKFVITNASNVEQRSIDDVVGLNDPQESFTEWVPSGIVPIYVNATTFTVPGDLTGTLQEFRRIRYELNTGTFYGFIFSSSYDSGDDETTVVVAPDSTSLDATVSAFAWGFVSADPTSIPQQFIIDASDAVPDRANHRGHIFDNDGVDSIWRNPAFTGRASNTIMGVADAGGRTKFTAAFTQTLAAAATLTSGWTHHVMQGHTGVTILKANGAEVFNTAAGPLNEICMYPGESFEIICTGTGFDVVGRQSVVSLAAMLAASAVATVTFRNGFTDPELAAIKVYGSEISGVSGVLAMQVEKSAAFVTGATYSSGITYSNGATAVAVTANTFAYVSGQSATGSDQVSFEMTIIRPTDAAGTNMISSDAAVPEVSNPKGNRMVIGSYETTAAAITAIKLYGSAGGTITGRLSCFGYRG